MGRSLTAGINFGACRRTGIECNHALQISPPYVYLQFYCAVLGWVFSKTVWELPHVYCLTCMGDSLMDVWVYNVHMFHVPAIGG